jgi:N-acetylgalactosamine kinase
LLEVEKEILKIKVAVTAPLSPETAKPFPLWRKLFQEMPGPLETLFHEIYGDDRDLIEERIQAHTECLDYFQRHFGNDRKVVMSRAPGRLNFMGRHVEHRGGYINVIAIDKEILCVAAARNDDTIRMVNVNREFEERSFRISDHLAEIDWQDWIGYLNLKETQKMVLDSKGDWANYVKAAVIRLQYNCRDRKLKGMDMAFHGNIPIAAGLSSSSAVVVATAEATIALNGLEIEPSDFVDLCGEGEWFAGARKGGGEHAALKFGKRGHIAHIELFPFRLEGNVTFPVGCSLVVANSMVNPQKAAGAADIYNQRIASYEFGFRILKDRFPDISYKLHYLRDINPDNPGLTASRIYEMLMAIPEKATLEEIYKMLPETQHQDIQDIVAGHSTPAYYNIRSILLYGIAECERSRLAKSILEGGDLTAFGEMMGTSHDGDRVMKFHEGKGSRYEQPANAQYIERLIDDLQSEDPERVSGAQLEKQPGAYSCSVPETDLLVDIAGGTEGVVGAQLSGAGLGGCVMILVYSKALNRLTRALEEGYYQPKGLESGITVCTPVTGSMIWRVKS